MKETKLDYVHTSIMVIDVKALAERDVGMLFTSDDDGNITHVRLACDMSARISTGSLKKQLKLCTLTDKQSNEIIDDMFKSANMQILINMIKATQNE